VTSGIGAALARRIAEAGGLVVGLGRDVAKLGPATESFVPVVADLAEPEEVARAGDEILRRLGRVDALVNNAAECVYETPLGFPPARWRSLLQVNLLAVIELTQRLTARMGPGAHVVNVSSVTARFLPNERFAPYALTKAALESWHAALRLELEPMRIKTTLIAPGLVDTPIYDKVQGFEKAREKIREKLPRWLDANDVAAAILWALECPEHVVVGEMTLYPLGQAR
jgi:serine 3-dehydrogenase